MCDHDRNGFISVLLAVFIPGSLWGIAQGNGLLCQIHADRCRQYLCPSDHSFDPFFWNDRHDQIHRVSISDHMGRRSSLFCDCIFQAHVPEKRTGKHNPRQGLSVCERIIKVNSVGKDRIVDPVKHQRSRL